MNTVKMWAVYQNTDATEGRGREYVQYYCLTEEVAKVLAKNNYVMGTDSPVKQVVVFYYKGMYYEVPKQIHPIDHVHSTDNFDDNIHEMKNNFYETAKKLKLTDVQIEKVKKVS